MSIAGDTNLHFWLTRSVGRCVGLNFRVAMDEGRLSPDDYLDLIHACRGCPNVASCQRWLGGQNGEIAGCAPAFCRIAAALDRLKPH